MQKAKQKAKRETSWAQIPYFIIFLFYKMPKFDK